MGRNPSDDFDPYVHELMKQMAIRLRRHPALRSSPLVDLFQSFATRLTSQRGKHDPDRASFHTFAERVLQNHARNLIKHARSAKRDDRRVDHSTDVALVMRDGRDDAIDLDAVLDVRAAMNGLPDDLRVVAELLSRYQPPEVQRRLKLTRAAMRHRMKLLHST